MKKRKIILIVLVIIMLISIYMIIKYDPKIINFYQSLTVKNNFFISEQKKFTVPILGEINAQTVSLPILSIIIGTIDGFNPCALWILIFLITMLFGMKNQKKMWILGITFIATSGLIYFLFMISWLNLAMFLTKIIFIRLLLSIFSIIFGMINIYRYLKTKDENVGCDVTKEKQRKKIMFKIKNIISKKSFILAILGIILLAASVNILELLCSLGLPVVFIQILSLNNLNFMQYILYVGLYIFFFLFDDILIFGIAMKTLTIKSISNKYTKYSHLIGGIIMIIIGLLMVLKPGWLMFNFK